MKNLKGNTCIYVGFQGLGKNIQNHTEVAFFHGLLF